MVLLRSDGSFPLAAPCRIDAYGTGVRRTVKGGTGSGDVNSRHVVGVEEGLARAGFEVTTAAWLDAYDALADAEYQAFVADIKTRAKAAGVPPIFFGMGAVVPAPTIDLPLDGDGDVAVYVVSRDSGEGADRRPVPGDVMLTDSEVRDILALEAADKPFLLVLNVGGPVDLSPVKDVANILVLSQLGAVTGDAFADVLLGKAYPSGHLATTWAAWEDYPAVGTFGENDDTEYREGLYVGYRYLDSVGSQPLFAFGHGLGWTTFAIGEATAAIEASTVTVTVPVTNTGTHPGKEVVQVYVSVPAGDLDQPYQALAGFTKTAELAPGAGAGVSVSFDLADLASYDEATAATVLEAGDYVVRVGTSSRATRPAAVVTLDETAVVRRLHDVLGDPGFTDWRPEAPTAVEVPAGAPRLAVAAADLRREDTQDAVDLSEELAFVRALSDDDLTYLVLGDYAEAADKQSIIGQAASSLIGAAGQSTTRVEGVPPLVLPDGPAGLRLTPQVGVDERGAFPLGNAFGGLMGDLMDEESLAALGVVEEPRTPQSTYEQYTTAIPIGTAVAQTWDPALAAAYGDLVGTEMEHFGAHLWLAPAFNLHRSILCGRNFEYFSEDPLLSGRIAAGITRGVQQHPGRGVTVKHFAFNNQETNRLNSNSRVSKRAARDLYLRSFEICVREAQPHGLMTSYNLVNGVHTSESADLLEKVLREEWGYQGLVMTDWVVRSMTRTDLKHPRAAAGATVAAGNELYMPACEEDRQDILAALAGGSESGAALTRERLELQAARVVRMAWRLAR
ncbi:glycoside hydrolase family 3 C-terminal domain-containing protein [Actinomyces sp. 186855]|nr:MULTISPECIES: glycoside hydrolase family 3 N-terminal domain-containing protein [unclassified Actinomyces]MCL3777638.1 glycoside hydrolase family 3 C-terminal domain-containing protein [Actinomyces sp. AC-20-1]MCL3790021.1 glycoside hydrolase family 3 C-terminal domain-containing protein [Actinomyces sp. 187325]MCL3792418.1 glycoside hydrolase family 3 C-terminal domain-containing protein [Actinomyces sp. 186855]MCL3794837.1 glycoside hydrolase family 3 C-terminal domain-containing protein [